MLANDTGSVSLALDHTRDPLPNRDLRQAHRSFEALFRRLYPSAEWFRSEVTTLNGRECILLELRTPAIDTDVRNLMLATPVDDRLLLITVNMTRQLEDTWLSAGGILQAV
ncbi:MAG: hypothetical protein HYU41_26535 [Candidatus Rokubacteria bacterium]|nr:hypothetical protein [Candidatus Rokubacteria bacterium]